MYMVFEFCKFFYDLICVFVFGFDVVVGVGVGFEFLGFVFIVGVVFIGNGDWYYVQLIYCFFEIEIVFFLVYVKYFDDGWVGIIQIVFGMVFLLCDLDVVVGVDVVIDEVR